MSLHLSGNHCHSW